MSKRYRAPVASMRIGEHEIPCLLMEDGSFRVAATQLADLNLASRSNASKTAKRLLGADYQLVRHASQLNSNPVVVLTLKEFEIVLTRMAYAERKTEARTQARVITETLVGLSLVQLAHDAHGLEFDRQDRTEWMKNRVAGKAARRKWTDIVKDHLDKQGLYFSNGQETREYFKWLTVKVNRGLFNQDHFNCDRDNMDKDELQLILNFEMTLAARSVKRPTHTPEELIDWVLEEVY